MAATTSPQKGICLPAEAGAVLDWWYPRVEALLGDDLVCVALYGGVTLGDFAPAWSDIDACVVVRRSVTTTQAAGLNTLMRAAADRYVNRREDGWQSEQAVQGAVITESTAQECGRDDWNFAAWGSQGRRVHGDPFSPFDRLLLARHAHVYQGAKFSFPEPATPELAAITRHDLDRFFAKPADSAQRHGAVTLAGLVHWWARALVFWQKGRLAGKNEACRLLVQQGHDQADAVALALEARTEGMAAARAREDELRAAFLAMAAPARQELEAAINVH
jgi:hypothetical protein